jgi:hypothetical protein
MPSTIDAPDMPRLDVLDEELGGDAAALARARRRRTGARLLMLAGVALGLGAIGALAFAWSNGDGRLRSRCNQRRASESARGGGGGDRAAARQVEALQDDVKELTEAQRQAAYTIATVKAGRAGIAPPYPAPYWYSNPEALNPVIARGSQSAAAAPLPRRPPGGRAEPREPRGRETAVPSSPTPPR